MLSRYWPARLRLGASLKLALTLTVAAAGPLGASGAHADGASEQKAAALARCARRLSIALLGASPDAALLASGDPQAEVGGLLATPAFADRFARFVNSQFNGAPVALATDDPVYYLARYVVAEGKPWSELFVGAYAITASTAGMDVTADSNGLGYFRCPSWMRRYAGNEPDGYMLSAAFRVLSNTTGLTLTPSVGKPGGVRTSTGRQQEPCRRCHFDAWFALDKVARLFPMRHGQAPQITFTPRAAGPQTLLGKSILDDRDLVQTLVASDAWRWTQCRMVFQFLYGRAENQCEARTFDACADALASGGTIQAAIAAVAQAPAYCD